MLAKLAQGVLDAVTSATTAVAAAAGTASAVPAAAAAESELTTLEASHRQDDAQAKPGTRPEVQARTVDSKHADGNANEAEGDDEDEAENDHGETTSARGTFSVARARRTPRSSQVGSPALLSCGKPEKIEAAEVDDDPSCGKDGKQYLLAGLYYSATTAAHAAAATANRTGSNGSRTTRTALPRGGSSRTTSTARHRWREIEPSKTTAFPPPVFYGATLLEPPEDADSDEENEAKGACRPFRLPFDILRDHWYSLSLEPGRDQNPDPRFFGGPKQRGKRRAASALVHSAAGEDEVRRRAARTGKGGDKTTEEDILKREQSKKPPAYRYIGKSESPAAGSRTVRSSGVRGLWQSNQALTRGVSPPRGSRRLCRSRTGQGRNSGCVHVSTPRARQRDGLRPRLHQPVSRFLLPLFTFPAVRNAVATTKRPEEFTRLTRMRWELPLHRSTIGQQDDAVLLRAEIVSVRTGPVWEPAAEQARRGPRR